MEMMVHYWINGYKFNHVLVIYLLELHTFTSNQLLLDTFDVQQTDF